MKAKWFVPTIILCGIVGVAVPLLTVSGQPAGESLLPKHSIWKLRYDNTLDGKLENPSETQVRFSVINNRVIGKSLDQTWQAKTQYSGEIAFGKHALVVLRQDNDENNYTCIWSGRFHDKGRRIVGTFHDNHGTSGDFEMIFERED
jgi:hypothetical protein